MANLQFRACALALKHYLNYTWVSRPIAEDPPSAGIVSAEDFGRTLGPFDARPAEAGIAQPSGERCLAAVEYREGSIVETQRMGASGEVTIREVALRDGLQSEKMFVPTDQKRSLIRSLSQAGVEFMETTSFVSPKAIPQLRDAAELMAQVERGQMKHEVMVPNEKGARAALEAGADRLIVFVSASEAHNQANVRRSVAASLADLDAIFSLAREKDVPVAGAIAVAFGCPFQGRVPRTDVLEIARHFADLGADRISLADTTGLANPGQISDYVSFFTGQLPDTAFCLHLHNNRGVAMANLYAGYLAGITLFDTSLGGIGGCPNVPQAAGNLATEDVVFMFEEMGVATGLDLCRLIDAAKELEKMLDHPLPGQVMKSGPSGWHTTGAACGAA